MTQTAKKLICIFDKPLTCLSDFLLFCCGFQMKIEPSWNYLIRAAEWGEELNTLDTHDAFITLHKTWSIPLRISSVNMTTFAGNCGFGHIYWRNPYWKTSFFVQCYFHISNCNNARDFFKLKIISAVFLIAGIHSSGNLKSL